MSDAKMEYCPECGIKSTAGLRVLNGEKGDTHALRAELEKQKSANAWLRKCVATRDAQIDELVAERDAALEREQALAAHVESLRQYIGQWGDGYVYDEDMMKQLFKWASSPADGSLTRRDLIKQAEALEEFGNAWDWVRMPSHKDLRHAGYHIRQRAKALK